MKLIMLCILFMISLTCFSWETPVTYLPNQFIEGSLFEWETRNFYGSEWIECTKLEVKNIDATVALFEEYQSDIGCTKYNNESFIRLKVDLESGQAAWLEQWSYGVLLHREEPTYRHINSTFYGWRGPVGDVKTKKIQTAIGLSEVFQVPLFYPSSWYLITNGPLRAIMVYSAKMEDGVGYVKKLKRFYIPQL